MIAIIKANAPDRNLTSASKIRAMSGVQLKSKDSPVTNILIKSKDI